MPKGIRAGALTYYLNADPAALKLAARQSGEALRNYQRSVQRAQSTMRRAGNQFRSFRRSVFSVRGAMTALAGSAGIGLMVRRFAEAADVMTLAQSRLKLVTQGTNELRQAQANLFAIAQQTGSAYEDTVTLYSRLARATEDLGISQRKMLMFTRAVNQSLIVSGTTAQEARAGMIQLSQGLASNRLGGDEFRSVSEQLTRFTRALADGLGVSIGKLRELSHAGKLTAETVLNATIGQAPKIAQEFVQIERTVQRSFTELRNQYLQSIDEINRSTEASQKLIKAVDELRALLASPKFQKDAVEGLTLLARAFQFALENADKIAVFFGAVYGIRLAVATKQSLNALGAVNGLSQGFDKFQKGLRGVVGGRDLVLLGTHLKTAQQGTSLFSFQLKSLALGLPGIAVAAVATLAFAFDRYAKSAEEARSRTKEFESTYEKFKGLIENTARSTASAENKLKDYRNTLKLLNITIDEVRTAAREERGGTNLEKQYRAVDEALSALSRALGVDVRLLQAGAEKAAGAIEARKPVVENFLRNYNTELERGLAIARQELEAAKATGDERLRLEAGFKAANDLVNQQVRLMFQLADAQAKLAAASEQQKDAELKLVEAAEANLEAFETGMLPRAKEFGAVYLEIFKTAQQTTLEFQKQQALLQAPVEVLRFEDEITDSIRELEEELNRLTGQAVEKTARGGLEGQRRGIALQLRDAALLGDEAAVAGLVEQLDLIKGQETDILKLLQKELDLRQLIADKRTERQVEQAVQPFLIEEFDKQVAAELKRIENANRLALLRGEELFDVRQRIKLEGTRADLEEAIAEAREKGNAEELKALKAAQKAINDRLDLTSALTDEQQEQLRIAREIEKTIKEFTDRQKELQQAAEGFSQAITKGMEDAILGANSLRDALAGVLQEIAKILLRVALLNQIERVLTGVFGGVFGVPGKAASVPGKAAGGPVEAGRLYAVGEKGVELFRPRTAGEIIPNHVLRSATPIGGGAPVINISINVQSTDGPGVRAALAEAVPVIREEVGRAVKGDVTRDLLRPSVLRRTRER